MNCILYNAEFRLLVITKCYNIQIVIHVPYRSVCVYTPAHPTMKYTFVYIQTSAVSGMDGVEWREEEEQMDSHCSGGIRACSRLRMIASNSHPLPCELSRALGKMKKHISSLVPRPSITANTVEGLVKLLRRMTSGGRLEAWLITQCKH